MAVVIDLAMAGQYFGRMRREIAMAASNGLLLAGHRAVQKIVAEIIPSRSPQPVDRGTYKAGWKAERVTSLVVLISNPEPHAAFIEYGVRAENVKIGTAMIQALAEWALRKGIASDEKESIGVAWAIAKAATRQGLFTRQTGKGLGILKELKEQFLEKIVQEEVSRAVQKAIDGVR